MRHNLDSRLENNVPHELPKEAEKAKRFGRLCKGLKGLGDLMIWRQLHDQVSCSSASLKQGQLLLEGLGIGISHVWHPYCSPILHHRVVPDRVECIVLAAEQDHEVGPLNRHIVHERHIVNLGLAAKVPNHMIHSFLVQDLKLINEMFQARRLLPLAEVLLKVDIYRDQKRGTPCCEAVSFNPNQNHISILDVILKVFLPVTHERGHVLHRQIIDRRHDFDILVSKLWPNRLLDELIIIFHHIIFDLVFPQIIVVADKGQDACSAVFFGSGFRKCHLRPLRPYACRHPTPNNLERIGKVAATLFAVISRQHNEDNGSMWETHARSLQGESLKEWPHMTTNPRACKADQVSSFFWNCCGNTSCSLPLSPRSLA